MLVVDCVKKLCCAVLCENVACEFFCFEFAFFGMSRVDLYVLKTWRALAGLTRKMRVRNFFQLADRCGTHACGGKNSLPKKQRDCWQSVEKSSHLSIPAVLFSKVTAASFSVIGMPPFCYCVGAFCVLPLSQTPFSSLAFVAVDVCRFFSDTFSSHSY